MITSYVDNKPKMIKCSVLVHRAREKKCNDEII